MNDDIVLMAVILSDTTVREMGTGKVSFIGTFHLWQFPTFPCVVPPFFATPLLTNIRGKMDKPATVTLRIEDPKTGMVMVNISGNFNTPPDYSCNGTEVVEMPFPIMPFQINGPGVYSVVIFVNGEKIGSRPFPINLLTVLPNQPKP